MVLAKYRLGFYQPATRAAMVILLSLLISACASKSYQEVSDGIYFVEAESFLSKEERHLNIEKWEALADEACGLSGYEVIMTSTEDRANEPSAEKPYAYRNYHIGYILCQDSSGSKIEAIRLLAKKGLIKLPTP